MSIVLAIEECGFQWEICFFLSRTTITTNGSETSQNIIIDGQVTNSFEENHEFENVVSTEVHHECLFVTRLVLLHGNQLVFC